MKSFTAVTILCSIISLLLIASVSACNMTWGIRDTESRKLARDVVTMKAAWLGQNKVTIVFPPKGHETYSHISFIDVKDYGDHESISTAELVGGGPGFTTATIDVKSQSRKPINMTITYFGADNKDFN